MEAKLYVGNLPFTTGDGDLQSLFSQAGTVKSEQALQICITSGERQIAYIEFRFHRISHLLSVCRDNETIVTAKRINCA